MPERLIGNMIIIKVISSAREAHRGHDSGLFLTMSVPHNESSFNRGREYAAQKMSKRGVRLHRGVVKRVEDGTLILQACVHVTSVLKSRARQLCCNT